MFRIFSFLNPSFMRRIDTYFLLHFRLLWATKIHYLLYYAVLLYTVSAVFASFYPLNTGVMPESEGYTIFLSFPLAALFFFWLRQQTFFSIEEQFGTPFRGMEQAKWLVYLVSIVAFVGLPMFMGIMLDKRINNYVTTEEFVEDIDAINLASPFFMSGTSGLISQQIKGSFCAEQYRSQSKGEYHDEAACGKLHYYPTFYTGYDVDQKSEIELITEFQNLNGKAAILQVIDKSLKLFRKYGAKVDMTAQEVYEAYREGSPIFESSYRSDIRYLVNENLSIISTIKAERTWWQDIGFWKAVVVMVLLATSFINTYRHAGLRNMIFAALAAGVMMIVIGFSAVFIQEILHASGKTSEGFVIFVITALFFGFTGRTIYNYLHQKTYSLPAMLMAILANVVTPFIFVWTCLVSNIMHIDCLMGCERTSDYYYSQDHRLFIMMMLGIVVYLTVAMPFYRNYFVRVSSLPKE